MQRWRRVFMVALAVGSLAWLGCDEGPLAPRSGTLVVAVYNRGDRQQPVANVAIEVTPVGRHATTGDDGKVRFELAPGGYYLDATVCSIHYHEPVTVAAGKQTDVNLDVCFTGQREIVWGGTPGPAGP